MAMVINKEVHFFQNSFGIRDFSPEYDEAKAIGS